MNIVYEDLYEIISSIIIYIGEIKYKFAYNMNRFV